MIDSSIIYSLFSVYTNIYIGCPYYNAGFPYSDMGTEYGHPRYLWN